MSARAPAVDALAGARALALYLLSLHSVAHAVLAWGGPVPSRLLAIAGWSAILGAALLVGEALGPRLTALVDTLGRGRIRVVAVAVYTGLVFLAPPIVAADPRLMQKELALFATLQPVFLLLAASERGVLGALENALVLVVFAALRGGFVAGMAVTGFLGLLGVFLVLDETRRVLAAYPGSRALSLGVTLGRAGGVVLPPVVFLALFFLIVPPTPVPHLTREAPAPLATGEIAAAYNALTFLALLFGGGLYIAYRFLPRRSRPEPPVTERLEAERVLEEVVEEAEPLAAVAHAGPRGRIVRAYVWFVAQAGRLAVRRRPSATPREFAAQVREPAAPLARLTDLFVRARYGPDEPAPDDAEAAERAAKDVVAALRRPRPAPRTLDRSPAACSIPPIVSRGK